MQNLKHQASLYSWAGQFEPYLVRNPEDVFLWRGSILGVLEFTML